MTGIAPGSGKQVAGANLPWGEYGFDFGSAPSINWHQGVSTPLGRQALDWKFRQLAIHDVPVVRWFLFCDGRAGIEFDARTGRPAGLTPGTVADIHAALELAAKHKVQIHFSLLDFHFGTDAVTVSTGNPDRPLQKGGHGDVLHSAEGREALLENVLRPALRAIGAHPGVFAIEFMNEPEQLFDMDLKGLGGTGRKRPIAMPADDVSVKDHPFVGQKDIAPLVAFAAKVGEEVHELTGKPFTIGSAEAKYMPLWHSALNPAAGDFAQFHSYAALDALDQAAIQGMTGFIPVMVGEFAVSPPGAHDTLERRFEAWLDAGFSGVLGWRAFGSDGATGPMDFAAWDRFFQANRQRLDRLAQTPRPGWRGFLDRLGLGTGALRVSTPPDGSAFRRQVDEAARRAAAQREADARTRLAAQVQGEIKRLHDSARKQLEDQRKRAESLMATRRAAEERLKRSRPIGPSLIGGGVHSGSPIRPGRMAPGGRAGEVGPVRPIGPRSRTGWVNDRYVFQDLDRRWDGSIAPGPFRGTVITRIPGHWQTRRW